MCEIKRDQGHCPVKRDPQSPDTMLWHAEYSTPDYSRPSRTGWDVSVDSRWFHRRFELSREQWIRYRDHHVRTGAPSVLSLLDDAFVGAGPILRSRDGAATAQRTRRARALGSQPVGRDFSGRAHRRNHRTDTDTDTVAPARSSSAIGPLSPQDFTRCCGLSDPAALCHCLWGHAIGRGDGTSGGTVGDGLCDRFKPLTINLPSYGFLRLAKLNHERAARWTAPREETRAGVFIRRWQLWQLNGSANSEASEGSPGAAARAERSLAQTAQRSYARRGR